MASFAMSTEDLAAATLDAVKARAIALEAPMSDEDAAGLATLVNGGDISGAVTEDKYDAIMQQINAMTKEQLGQMLMMAKMMGGMVSAAAGDDGTAASPAAAMAEAMAQQMGAAMGAAMGAGSTAFASSDKKPAAEEGTSAGEEKSEEAAASGGNDEPSDEDKEKFHNPDGAWRMSIPRSVKIDELLRLLNVFKGYANTRWPKAKPERVYVDKVCMAIRGCSSVIKSRQDAAVAAGVVGPLVEVLTGVHLEDRETCLRTIQCILGICGKNDDATAAFKAAGAGDAVNAIHAKHKDSNSKDFEKAVAMFQN